MYKLTKDFAHLSEEIQHDLWIMIKALEDSPLPPTSWQRETGHQMLHKYFEPEIKKPLIKKYFLSFMGMEKEVTKEEYIKAERQAGFHSKLGPDHEATGGFGSGGMKGSTRWVEAE